MSYADRVRGHVRESLWVYPAVAALLAVATGTLSVALDHSTGTRLGFAGGAEAARTILSTIAAAMITFTGLVFSITILALQLASGQFSPRVMRTFLRDRTSKLALATFVATFIFAFTVLRATRADDVPGISVTLSIVLVFVSVAVFIHYIHHTAQSIRASTIIESVAVEARACLERNYPADRDDLGGAEPARTGRPAIVLCPEPGVITGFDTQRMVVAAREAEALIVLRAAVGEFVPAGAPLLEVHGASAEECNVKDLVSLARERTMHQDLAFGFRQLVDLATKALSPGINDPTTAVQALDQIHDLLRRLASRPIPAGTATDSAGVVRLAFPTMDWERFVGLSVDEIRDYGTDSVQVQERLRRMLDDLMEVADESSRPPLRARRQALPRG